MDIHVLQTGSTVVSSAVPDRSSHRWAYAYTDLFQHRSKRISVPVKAFLVEAGGHRVLVGTGWSAACAVHPIAHLGFGLWFASEPVMTVEEAIPAQLGRLGLKPADLDANVVRQTILMSFVMIAPAPVVCVVAIPLAFGVDAVMGRLLLVIMVAMIVIMAMAVA